MSVPHAGLRGHVENSLYTAGGMEEAEMRRLRIEDEEPRGSKRKEEEQNKDNAEAQRTLRLAEIGVGDGRDLAGKEDFPYYG